MPVSNKNNNTDCSSLYFLHHSKKKTSVNQTCGKNQCHSLLGSRHSYDLPRVHQWPFCLRRMLVCTVFGRFQLSSKLRNPLRQNRHLSRLGQDMPFLAWESSGSFGTQGIPTQMARQIFFFLFLFLTFPHNLRRYKRVQERNCITTSV